jgi:hypothetical protein
VTVYRKNGQQVTREQWLGSHRRRKANMAGIIEARRPPGGHEPYWGCGHESMASGVPAEQAKEHHDWCQSQGLVGVEVKKDGNVVTNSPGGRQAYLAARGLIDAGTAGADSKCMRDKKTKRRR